MSTQRWAKLGKIKMEVNTGIRMGQRCYYRLGSMIGSKVLSEILKFQSLTSTLPVTPKQFWDMDLEKGEKTRLALFERTVLRRICGPRIDSDHWNDDNDTTRNWKTRFKDQTLSWNFLSCRESTDVRVWRKKGCNIDEDSIGKRPFL